MITLPPLQMKKLRFREIKWWWCGIYWVDHKVHLGFSIDIVNNIVWYRKNDIEGPYNQSYGFSSSHVQMWELDHKEDWVSKNWCFWTVVLEKTLESPLDCKEIKPVNPKGNQSWIFIGRIDVEAEAPLLWPPAVKSWLTGKDPNEKVEGKRRGWRQRTRWL